MANDDDFEIGDEVVLVGMAPELSGSRGKVVKTMGKGRYAVMVDGKDRSTVVNAKNLERFAAEEAPAKPYTIVGTWDDWEPHEMRWISGLKCFEHEVVLGNDSVESFKFLIDGDWDNCVYPSRTSANLHDGHDVCGPDDGGLDAEWTIGLHQTDQAGPGSRFRVRVFLAAGVPRSVQWEPAQQEDQQQVRVKEPVPKEQPQAAQQEPMPRAERARRVSWQDQEKAEPPPKSKPYYPEENLYESRYEEAPKPRDDPPRRGAREKAYDQRALEEEIEEQEKAARERLARRLEMAAEAEMKMITDGDEGTLQAEEKEKAALENKMAENKRRYMAQCGDRKERQKLYQGFTLEEAESAVPRVVNAPRPAVGDAKAAAEAPKIQGKCMECQLMTDNILDVGGFCCPVCWKEYQQSIQDGWNGAVLIGCLQAAQHAQSLVDQKRGSYTIAMARRDVMNTYPEAFGKKPNKNIYTDLARLVRERMDTEKLERGRMEKDGLEKQEREKLLLEMQGVRS
mmetsp:Transcript_114120/g.333583  ORF Transcript_114120/g.333583 Transcript_114120/m.333583 type:complete len:510 (-) Transcript_114120:107-1636(-)